MSILYLDTSALVKPYVHETGSRQAKDLIQGSDHAGTSLISRAEMPIARKAGLSVWPEKLPSK